MISNPQTCWQYCIQTNHLREPKESFQLLTYKIHHPEKTLEECCHDLNMNYEKALQWSSRYFYRTRQQAYTRDLTNELHNITLKLKQEELLHQEKHNKKEQSVLSAELYFLQKEMNQMIELEKQDQTIPGHLQESVNEKEKNYWNNKHRNAQANKIIYEQVTTPPTLEELEQLKPVEENPELKQFIQAMKGNRDAHNRK